jgi:hypothetical protein
MAQSLIRHIDVEGLMDESISQGVGTVPENFPSAAKTQLKDLRTERAVLRPRGGKKENRIPGKR